MENSTVIKGDCESCFKTFMMQFIRIRTSPNETNRGKQTVASFLNFYTILVCY